MIDRGGVRSRVTRHAILSVSVSLSIVGLPPLLSLLNTKTAKESGIRQAILRENGIKYSLVAIE